MSIHLPTKVTEEYIYPRMLDWAQIMRDLYEHITYNEVAKILGVNWGNVQRWRTGSEPGYSKGSAILLLHARCCGGELTKQRILEGKQ